MPPSPLITDAHIALIVLMMSTKCLKQLELTVVTIVFTKLDKSSKSSEAKLKKTNNVLVVTYWTISVSVRRLVLNMCFKKYLRMGTSIKYKFRNGIPCPDTAVYVCRCQPFQIWELAGIIIEPWTVAMPRQQSISTEESGSCGVGLIMANHDIIQSPKVPPTSFSWNFEESSNRRINLLLFILENREL